MLKDKKLLDYTNSDLVSLNEFQKDDKMRLEYFHWLESNFFIHRF